MRFVKLRRERTEIRKGPAPIPVSKFLQNSESFLSKLFGRDGTAPAVRMAKLRTPNHARAPEPPSRRSGKFAVGAEIEFEPLLKPFTKMVLRSKSSEQTTPSFPIENPHSVTPSEGTDGRWNSSDLPIAR
jgi:hypothetical protein